MKKYYLGALLIFICNVIVVGQYAGDFKVYKAETAGPRSFEKLLQSLIGDGVILKNYSITKTPSDEAFGFFEDKKARLGMKKGLVMTTGGIASLSSRNTSSGMSNNTHAAAEGRVGVVPLQVSCPDLEKLLGNNQKTFDACVIELDVVATADTLSFNYVFGSEEYDEYVGSEYNDVFAFFISGKGIGAEKNLAVVPNTGVPVSVNSINNGGGSGTYKSRPVNPTFYVSNIDGNVGIEYDGMTKLMEIRQAVIPYETYHIKLAIADVSDNSFDSGVLLEGRSIVSYEKKYSVLFDKNGSEIENGYKNLLDALVADHKKNNYKGKISVTGHTDSEGFEELNKELSCKRTQEVSAYLIGKGIDPSQIVMDCKGESMPAFDNNSDKGKALNRRVEIKLLGDNESYAAKKAEAASGIAAEKLKLLSNYPNPFSGITTIAAFVPEESKDASLLITDMNGKTLKTIYLLERGSTSAIFDGQALASGIYNATLLIDGKPSDSIKLMMTK